MSIVLKDGTVLPDIPSEVLAEYPYAFIVTSSIDATTILHTLFVTKNEFVVKLATDTGMDYDNLASKGFASVNGVAFSYDANSWEDSSNSAMTNLDASEVQQPIGTVVDGMTITLNWSNYDIMVAEADGYNPTVTVYFKSCIFILPDGTELPALPEGCFEKYPYGVISYVESTDGEAAYALSVAEGTYIFAPGSATGEGSDYVISLLPGYRHYRYVVAPTAASGWEQYAESTTQHSGHDFSREDGTIEIRWCNHDILTATAMNDDGTPEIGPDLYRKSDVNYRIYGGWLNSMGNQARRLGNVSGALKPGEMESVFSGATLEPLTVTPTTEEQTFTPESPCIGFSMVTVGAAPEQEIPDVPEPSYQDKTVTPSSEVQTVYPDSGYDALSSVTVEAIQVNQVVNNEEKTITENGTYTPSEGYTGFSSVTVEVPTYITVSSEDDLPSDSPEGTIAIVGG